MFKVDTFRKIDYWGVGVEACVQYDWLDETHTAKRSTGFALIIYLMTREFRLGYFWG